METRKVVIINSAKQRQSVLESTATTLGELKAEMHAAGIDYTGMTFYEGHMRAELKDDASPLPTNIPFKGGIVNDLTFMLSTPEKKIKSGAMSRAELIAEAKKLGFPSNPTQAKSAVLQEFIDSKMETSAPVEPQAEPKKAVKKEEKVEEVKAADDKLPKKLGLVIKAVNTLASRLNDDGTLEDSDFEDVIDILKKAESDVTNSKDDEVMSQSEIDDMFDFVGR